MTVLDASAVAALLFDEPGGASVAHAIASGGTVMSTVNFAEIAALLARRQVQDAAVILSDLEHQVDVVPFTTEHAYRVGVLAPIAADQGLGLGDRACLALGHLSGQRVITADKSWSKLPQAVAATIDVIR